MKKILSILMLLILPLMGSCEQDEILYLKTVYEFDPDQPTTINVDVIPVNDVVLEKEDMMLEVNADYFNRYGIFVNLNFKEAVTLQEGETLPYSDYGRITVYVVNPEYIKFPAFGYLLKYENYKGTMAKIVINKNNQTDRVLAHEIGHALGLNHVKLHNNVLKPYAHARQYGEPNEFVEAQVDTMLLDTERYSKNFSRGFIEKETLIID